MEFKDIVRNRCSIRQYDARPVPEETIQELLEIIGYSVSAINLQPWKIKVVSDDETKEKVFSATFGLEQVRVCSHALILCADVDYPTIIARLDRAMAAAGVPAERREGMLGFVTKLTSEMTPEKRLAWSREQVHIALGNAVNGAYSLGLGACPMTAFDPPVLGRALGLPETVVPTAIVSVGYAAEEGSSKLRYPVSDIVI
jgi:nitroreductase/dihydropteridine reductase